MLRHFYNKHFKSSQRGATSVEFSIIAAVLLVILFGIIEYAMLFLQEHYVANAAREAVRIGVRANNYDSYKNEFLPGSTTKVADRETIVKNSVAEYLNTFYDEDDSRAGTVVMKVDPDGNLATDTDRVLVVSVTVDNLFTNIAPGLLRLINPDSSVTSPTSITASAQMELENQEEFNSSIGTEY